jgi:hypothetical protein
MSVDIVGARVYSIHVDYLFKVKEDVLLHYGKDHDISEHV